MNKEKYTIEYELKSAPVMLVWNYIATAPGLSQWFADRVEFENKTFNFHWKGSTSIATQIGMRTGSFIRMRWEEDMNIEKNYFELKIVVSDITDSTILIVTDFAEKEDLKESKELWNYQIENLKRLLGCKN